MNSKITINKIAAELAAKSGRKPKDCETLLKSFFSTIENSLLEGESVRIKGFGSFKITRVEPRKSVDVSSGSETEIPAHRKVVFLPAKELAAAVNAPFEMFETIELEDNVLDEELREAEASGNDLAAQVIEGNMMLQHEKFDEELKETPAEEKNAPVEEKDSAVEENDSAAEENVIPAEDTPETGDTDDNIEPNEELRRSNFGHGFLWGIVATFAVLIAGVVALYFVNDDFANFGRSVFNGQKNTPIAEVKTSPTQEVNSDAPEAVELQSESDALAEEEAGVPDMVEDVVPDNADNVVPTKPSDPIIYDTITKTHYLTTMAKKYYGNYHLWPYIYKENEKILGHPDRIRPGTRVVIPKLSKYGVDPKNPDDIAKAKKLGAQIYSKYNK